MAKPFNVTDSTFEDAVLKAKTPVAVDFWAVWCGPCKMIAPVLEQIAAEYDGKLQVAKLDVDYNGQTAMQYGVMSIPTLMLFKNGEPVERIVGYMPKDRLLDKLRPYL
jgi:thioredoxin 1